MWQECEQRGPQGEATRLPVAGPKGARMSHHSFPVIASIVVSAALTAGCEHNSSSADRRSSQTPLSPSAVASGSAASTGGGASTAATHGLPDRTVTMMDACDPDTFNAPPPAGVGPGTCVRSGGVQFASFLEELGKHGVAGAWHFAPPNTSAKVGQVFVALNRGGEVHTFTEVEEFGGGLVPQLNELSGNFHVSPECLSLKTEEFIKPGRYTERDFPDEVGTEKYQCCIHPWMRATIHVTPRG